MTRINIENNRAIGITLENGEIYNGADVVISAADGHYTIFEMLEGKYCNKKIDDLYQKHPMWPSAVIVSLGLSRTFERESSQLELWLSEPFVVDEQSRLDSLPITIYDFDSTLADEGKTCVRAILRTDNYHYWHDLKENDSLVYEREKERVARSLIEILDKQMGNIIPYVEVADVATPATFYRYTNSWKGCTQGWEWLSGLIPETIKKELPGLKGFYMIGHWVMPGGGVSSALVLGRDVTRIICKRDKKKFRAKRDYDSGMASRQRIAADMFSQYSRTVEYYVRYRPHYPQALIGWLQAECALSSSQVIADIGSGTGQMTELFLKHGNPVYAIEPNVDMRRVGEHELRAYPQLTSIDATAEATTLPDHSVHLITVGNAFHWFKHDFVRQEFRRILVPQGWVILAWNLERNNGSPFAGALEQFWQKHIDPSARFTRFSERKRPAYLAQFFEAGLFKEKSIDNYQVCDFETLKGLALSFLKAPQAGDPRHGVMLEYDTAIVYGQLSV